MRNFKKFGVLTAVAFALSAIGAANASAASFTASATGQVSGTALETEVWTTSAGQIKCTTAETSGTIASTNSAEQHVTVNYKNCTAFGFANVHISPGTYLLTANGTTHIKNTIEVNVTIGSCKTIYHPQTVGTSSHINSAGHIVVTTNIGALHWTTVPAHGTICGTTGTNGAKTSKHTYQRVGGGSLSFDS